MVSKKKQLLDELYQFGAISRVACIDKENEAYSKMNKNNLPKDVFKFDYDNTTFYRVIKNCVIFFVVCAIFG